MLSTRSSWGQNVGGTKEISLSSKATMIGKLSMIIVVVVQ